MIDSRRVIQMTRMSMKLKKNGQTIEQISGLSRRDYLSYHGIKALFMGTVIYVILYAIVVAVICVKAITRLTSLWLVILLVGGLIGYLSFLLFYMSWTYREAGRKYDHGRKMVLDMEQEWNRLNSLYEEEERKSASAK